MTSVYAPGVGTTAMQYDYTGMRVKKDAPTGLTLFPFQGYEIAPNGEITKFIRIGVETFAAKRGTLQRFYHNDHLGSVNVITDINGVQVQRNEYDPWGSVSKQVGNDDPTHRFTGKELDPESGLYYYGGRYYDPEISRFVSADPFVPQPGNPQSLNRYSYTINNPQRYIDPSGYSFWSAIGNFFKNLFKKPQVFIAALVVGIVTGGAAYLAAPVLFGAGSLLGAGVGQLAFAGAVGGMFAGMTSAGMTGGNLWQAGLVGFIAGGVGGGVFGAMGGGTAATLGNVTASAFAGGATGGALNTAFNGGNFIVNTLAGGITSAITAAAVYGAGKGIQYVAETLSTERAASITSSSNSRAGLQFAAASGGDTMSDTPKYAASSIAESKHGIDLGDLYEMTIGKLDKAFTVTAVVAAGTFVSTVGGYLIWNSPTFGPIGGPIVAFTGAVLMGGGAFVLSRVPEVFSIVYPELSPKVPAVPAR